MEHDGIALFFLGVIHPAEDHTAKNRKRKSCKVPGKRTCRISGSGQYGKAGLAGKSGDRVNGNGGTSVAPFARDSSLMAFAATEWLVRPSTW